MYSLEKHQSASSNRCILKAAEIGSLMFENKEMLKNSIKIHEEIGREYLRNNLMRFSAKTLFVKNVMIFFLLEDDVGAEKSLEEYSSLDNSLYNSTEYKFMKKVIICMREGNKDQFETECVELNKRMTLDKWWIAVLSQIKGSMNDPQNAIEDFDPL